MDLAPDHPSPLPVLHCGYAAQLGVRWKGLAEGLHGEGSFVIVQPYVHGLTVREIAEEDVGERYRVTAALAASMTKQLADQPGLHDWNLKPANILIDEQGQPHLCDARQGLLRGPTRYTAPEQLLGGH